MTSPLDLEDLRPSGGGPPPGVLPRGPARPLRVVVVDEDPAVAEGLAILLELLGHEAWVAQDGPDGLATIAARLPDAVVLDVDLPGMDGFAVARAARVLPGAEGLSIAGLNGWGQADDRRRSRAAGFDAHFVKPVGLAELAAWLAAVQRRGDR